MKQILLIITIIITIILGLSSARSETDIQYNITVAKDGTGDFTNIQDAIDATKSFSSERIIIFIKNGVYKEKLKIPSWNTKLSLIGEDVDKTIITWDDHFTKINRGRNSTFFTYTMKVEANDFCCENLSVINAAGQVGQAVAIHVEGNRCRFNN